LGLDEQKTRGVLADHLWTKVGYGFLKRPSAKKAGKLLNLSRNQLLIIMGPLTGHCHLKGHLFIVELVKGPEGDRCKQAFEMASCFFVTFKL